MSTAWPVDVLEAIRRLVARAEHESPDRRAVILEEASITLAAAQLPAAERRALELELARLSRLV